jgi:DNA-binding transcriptional LysR family regulator
MIDRYHLRYFLAVIDQGNFSRAAEACNVSQPTLSVGVAKLEKALGRPLFRRTNRRVELTEAGVALAERARRIEAGFQDAERAVTGTEAGARVRLGLLTTLAPARVEALLADLAASVPAGGVEIVEGRERELADRLARGRIDVALTVIRGEGEVLASEGYVLAVAATHPLAGRDEVEAGELAREPMIVRRHCELLSETSRHFTARGVRPFFVARTTSEEHALRYVRQGLGVTVAPEGHAEAGVGRVRLAGFAHERRLGLMYAGHVEREALRAGAVVGSVVRVMG